MFICDKYLNNLLYINPGLDNKDINDKNIPNIYSKKYNKSINELNNKYIKYLDVLDNKNKYDKILEYDLINNTSLINYDYIPVNIYDNIFIDYILNTKGNHNYRFNNKEDYLNYIKYLKLLNNITNNIIDLLKKGIKNNIKYSQLIVIELINYFTYILDNKKYKHIKKIPSNIKKQFIKSIDLYLVQNIKRFIYFLKNRYINYTNNKK